MLIESIIGKKNVCQACALIWQTIGSSLSVWFLHVAFNLSYMVSLQSGPWWAGLLPSNSHLQIIPLLGFFFSNAGLVRIASPLL